MKEAFSRARLGMLSFGKEVSMASLIANRHRLGLNRGSLELLLYKTYADLRVESARTYIGVLWWIFDPAIQMMIYYVVFGVIMNTRDDVTDFVSYLLVGIVVWKWVATGLINGSMSILNNGYLIRQVYLPKTIFPVISLFTDTFKFLIAFAVVIVVVWLRGNLPNPAYIALPLVLAVQMFFMMGMAFLLAAVIPFYPDLKILVENSLRLGFYMSGVFFAAEARTDNPILLYLFYLNPVAILLRDLRGILLDGAWPHWYSLLAVFCVAYLAMFVGLKMISRWDHEYPRAIQ